MLNKANYQQKAINKRLEAIEDKMVVPESTDDKLENDILRYLPLQKKNFSLFENNSKKKDYALAVVRKLNIKNTFSLICLSVKGFIYKTYILRLFFQVRYFSRINCAFFKHSFF